MITWSKEVEFLGIKNPISNYTEQKSIDPTRIKKFLARALHYDLDIPTVVRFLGGNYTEEYRDIKNTIKILRESKCDEIIVNELKCTLETGCPNKMNATSTHETFPYVLEIW